jgi:hypothetical protein
MLLATLTAQLQSTYATIQIQIEELQEQQRQIQAQLQRIGSVESEMESAIALVSQAIASIKEICPEELGSYQRSVTSLFEGGDFSLLPPAPAPTPTPAPTPVEEISTIEVESESISDRVDQVNQVNVVDALEKLSIQKIRTLAKEKGVGGQGNRSDIARRLAKVMSFSDLKSWLSNNA